MALDHSCQVQRHPLAERGHDLYETPDVAVEALLRHERLPHRIWEPAAGKGNIVEVLRQRGHEVIATDLNNRGCYDSRFGVDFLLMGGPRIECDCILTNPPYVLAQQFVEVALVRAPLVVML